jgi:hypothetical protein
MKNLTELELKRTIANLIIKNYPSLYKTLDPQETIRLTMEAMTADRIRHDDDETLLTYIKQTVKAALIKNREKEEASKGLNKCGICNREFKQGDVDYIVTDYSGTLICQACLEKYAQKEKKEGPVLLTRLTELEGRTIAKVRHSKDNEEMVIVFNDNTYAAMQAKNSEVGYPVIFLSSEELKYFPQ